MALLEARGLVKQYGKHVAVNNLNLQLIENECLVLLGPNGAGKTTTLHMLAGLIIPTDGAILSENKAISRDKVGFLPQHPVFFNWMYPKEYLLLAGTLSGMTNRTINERIQYVLELTGLLKAQKQKIGSFSGGMKQRLGIAQAILHEPQILLLDEPVSALDPAGRIDVMNIMNVLKNKMTILFSTHVLHDAEQVGDKALIMRAGQGISYENMKEWKDNQLQERYRLETSEMLQDELLRKFYEHIEVQETKKVVGTLKPGITSNMLLQSCIEQHIQVRYFGTEEKSLQERYMEVMES
ncbi:ABC transporter ATP-binding protein [Terribacillus sp. DMT04]|uniref:ABC transporter ATP-binding protein n=1 Tax=Terribacillus sp. DMT04 TaxID=2850441 RepID=UPI001C2C252F|nr:ABC transporter ATP-binding protein [Terribacillus sp. DMT04]QXE01794.1 ABC transporter ATP-binding protein [Terribacillus sp. DMT04]